MKQNVILEDFEAFLAFEQRLSELSIQAYLSDTKLFLQYLKKKKVTIRQVIDADFEGFLIGQSRLNLSLATLMRRHSSLLAFSKFISTKYQLPRFSFSSPTSGGKSKKLPCFVSESSLRTVLEELCKEEIESHPKEAQGRLVLLFLYTLGLRVSELALVSLSAFSRGFASIRILGKGDKERELPLPSFLQKQLQAYLEGPRRELLVGMGREILTPFLFFNISSGIARPLTRHSIFAQVKSFAKKMGLPRELSPHKFRHSIATHLLSQGANLRMLQSFLGHSSISTVQIYTHLNIGKLREEYDKFHPRA